jgi:hypothetical protein
MKRHGQAIACVYEAIVYHKVGRSTAEISKRAALGSIYYHYLVVFLNMRYQWPKPVWRVWRTIYVFYIFYMVRTKYGASFHKTRQLILCLLRDSLKLNKIDRSIFEYSINEELW